MLLAVKDYPRQAMMEMMYLYQIKTPFTSYICQSPAEFHIAAFSLALSTHYDRPDAIQRSPRGRPALLALSQYLETS